MTTKLIKARANNRNRYFWSRGFKIVIIIKYEPNQSSNTPDIQEKYINV
jgi:hypothetical protein